MFYSFVVRTERDVAIPEHLLVIGSGPGPDTFNVEVSDLDAFLVRLRSEGVQVLEVHQLDGLEPVLPAPLTDEHPLLSSNR